MPRYTTSPKDIFAYLIRRLDLLDRQVASLRANNRPTLPIYRRSDIPDSLNDGEHWIGKEDGDLYWKITVAGDEIIMQANGSPSNIELP